MLRIDKFLMMDRLPNTCSKIRTQSGGVGFSEQPAYQISYKVKAAGCDYDHLPPAGCRHCARDIPLADRLRTRLLVVSKEARMVVHPYYNNWTGTLVNALPTICKTFDVPQQEGRPDWYADRTRGSPPGLLVIAKTRWRILPSVLRPLH